MMTRHAECEHGLPSGCPLHHRRATRARVVGWVVIGLAVAAFWGCVWFGIIGPLLGAWRGR